MSAVDQITLTGIRVFGYHGVFDEERRTGQFFIVDLTLHVDTSGAAETDDVADTVHYGEVAEAVAAIVAGEPVNLLEKLAARIAARILEFALVQFVSVTIHKPDAPIPVPFTDVSVTISRAKEHS